MRIVQILLYVILSCIVNTKCNLFPPSMTNNYLPAEIEVDEKDDMRVADGNIGNVLYRNLDYVKLLNFV